MKFFLILCLFRFSVQALAITTEYTTKETIYAIGDIHGDLDRAKNLLKGMGLIDSDDNWCGGKSVLVQIGDQIDRWYQDKETIDYFEQLESKARQAGGRVFNIVGNHEINNSLQIMLKLPLESMLPFKQYNDEYSFISQGCKYNYEYWKKHYIDKAQNREAAEKEIAEKEEAGLKGRLAVFCPGGLYAKKMASWSTVLFINDFLFVHGSLERTFANLGRKGLANINSYVSEWFMGNTVVQNYVADWKYDFLYSEQAPFNSREYAYGLDEKKCKRFAKVLDKVKAKKMIIGHTPQVKGVRTGCNDKIYKIDTGFSRGFVLNESFYLPKKLEYLKIEGQTFSHHVVEDEYRNANIENRIKSAIKKNAMNCLDYSVSQTQRLYRCPFQVAYPAIDSILNGARRTKPWHLIKLKETPYEQDKGSCYLYDGENSYQVKFPGANFQKENDLCQHTLY